MPTADEIRTASTRRAAVLDAIRTSIRDLNRPPSLSELAARFDVSKRTIRIDLRDLQDQGKIIVDPGVARGIRIPPNGKRKGGP